MLSPTSSQGSLQFQSLWISLSPSTLLAAAGLLLLPSTHPASRQMAGLALLSLLLHPWSVSSLFVHRRLFVHAQLRNVCLTCSVWGLVVAHHKQLMFTYGQQCDFSCSLPIWSSLASVCTCCSTQVLPAGMHALTVCFATASWINFFGVSMVSVSPNPWRPFANTAAVVPGYV